MHTLSRALSTLILAAGLSMPLLIAGCSADVGYRTYDPYYNDYHVWNHDEVVYYNNWEHDTHREHRDFNKRSKDEQKEYYSWRHNHEHDNDHH
jgi:protein-tyrosine phosphatase